MNASKWYFHPIFIFILSILALSLSLFLYIYWYVEVSGLLHEAINRFNLEPQQFFETKTWLVILLLSVLFGIILFGMNIIFVYNQKTNQLFKLQNNFINNFTHELKTPVTSLQLFLESLIKHELPKEEQARYINFMLLDVKRLTNNINSILNLAKIESKNFKCAYEVKNLLNLIDEFLKNNRHIFENCEIDLIKNNPDETYEYPVDIALFEMFLMNILINAVKYNDSDKVKIIIRLAKDKKNLFLKFTDNGVGLTRKNLNKIFKKFYQVEGPDNYVNKGTGLGLYLAQGIARLHKGKIFAENREDVRGAVFTLVLPIAQNNKKN